MTTDPIEHEYSVLVENEQEGTSKSFVMTAESILGVCLYVTRRYPSPARLVSVSEL